MSGLLDCLSDFQTDALTVTRTAIETYDANGRASPSGMTSTLQVPVVQVPANGRDLQIKIDCGITTEIRVLLTSVPLFTRSPSYEPDALAIDGDTWTVFNWEKWPTGDGDTFYRVRVARQSMQ